ncbi:MAG: iron-sulfur cluster insertion protein ErpA [Acidobacteriota bacterium]
MSEKETAAESAGTVEALVHLSEKAVAKINQFSTARDEYKGKLFRVYIEGGGCSGFQYGFTFDQEKDGDIRVESGSIDVLVDLQSAMYLKGSTVDFVEDLRGAGFVVKNPNASGTCGCGHSFSV